MHWKDRDIWLRLEFLVGLAAAVLLMIATFISRMLNSE